MRIDTYSFGRIVIENREYRKDLILLPHRIITPWWRLEGHLLQEADLAEVIEAAPEVLIVGTGASGMMRVPERLVEALAAKGIRVVAAPTEKAVEQFNRSAAGPVAGAFHLTC